jgi:hypothetical protein
VTGLLLEWYEVEIECRRKHGEKNRRGNTILLCYGHKEWRDVDDKVDTNSLMKRHE